MDIKRSLISLLVLLNGMQVLSQNVVHQKFGKGMINHVAKDSSFSAKVNVRMQTLYVGNWNLLSNGNVTGGSSEFLIRRWRLKFGGFAVTPKLQYKIELGISNKDQGKISPYTNDGARIILDAVLKWNFYENFVLWAGQTKLPGNRERVISSGDLQFVDRSYLNKKFNIDRDMGVQLRHTTHLFGNFYTKEKFAISQGEGRNVVYDNLGGYQYTTRLELFPMGKFKDHESCDMKRHQTPKLAFGFTYDYNDNAVKTRSNLGSYMAYDTNGDGDIDGYFETDIKTLFADMIFKYKGFSLMGEYAYRDASKVKQSIVNSDATTTSYAVYVGESVNLQAGYLFKNNWEIAGRYTQVTPRTEVGKPSFAQYTLGVSKYIAKHKLKVQSDFSYLEEYGNPTSGLMARLQIEMQL